MFICLSGRSQFPASERDSASRWEETLKAVAGTVTRKLDSPASFEFDAFSAALATVSETYEQQ